MNLYHLYGGKNYAQNQPHSLYELLSPKTTHNPTTKFKLTYITYMVKIIYMVKKMFYILVLKF